MGSLLGQNGLEQSLEEWICIGGEQGGYFCGKNGVSPGHLPDLKGVVQYRKERDELGGVGPDCSQPARQKSHY